MWYMLWEIGFASMSKYLNGWTPLTTIQICDYGPVVFITLAITAHHPWRWLLGRESRRCCVLRCCCPSLHVALLVGCRWRISKCFVHVHLQCRHGEERMDSHRRLFIAPLETATHSHWGRRCGGEVLHRPSRWRKATAKKKILKKKK